MPTPRGLPGCSLAQAPTAPSRSAVSNWDRYVIPDPSRAGNVVGRSRRRKPAPDIVLIYGSADEKTLEKAAAAVSDQVVKLREATP